MNKSDASQVQPASALISQRIAKLGDWRGETLSRVRKLIQEADSDVVEEWKWRGTPVWSHDGIVCTGESYKNVVKLTFAQGASLQDPARSSIRVSKAAYAAPSTSTRGMKLTSLPSRRLFSVRSLSTILVSRSRGRVRSRSGSIPEQVRHRGRPWRRVARIAHGRGLPQQSQRANRRRVIQRAAPCAESGVTGEKRDSSACLQTGVPCLCRAHGSGQCLKPGTGRGRLENSPCE